MTFLIYATEQNQRNSTGRNAVLVSGASESAARAAANDNAPDGETKVRPSWTAMELTGADDLDAPIWLYGVAEPLLRSRGG
jgi:hypothetical protein